MHTCGVEFTADAENISAYMELPIPSLKAPCQLSPGSITINENGVINSYSLDSIDGKGKSEQALRKLLGAQLAPLKVKN